MLMLAVQSDLSALAEVRRAVQRWAADNGFDAFPLTLIAVELVTNAVEAAGGDASVELLLAPRGSGIEVRVSDTGPGFDPVPDGGPGSWLPSVSAERGRGLYLVRQLSRDLEVSRSDGRTTVRTLVAGATDGRDCAATSANAPVAGGEA